MTLPEDSQQDEVEKPAIKVWEKNYPENVDKNGPVRRTGVVLKHTRNMYINASLTYWGGTPEEPTGGNLAMVRMPPSSEETWDFSKAEDTIVLSRSREIQALRSYLNYEFDGGGSGQSHWVEVNDEHTAQALRDVLGGKKAEDFDLQKLTDALSLDDDFIAAVVDHDQAELAVQVRERRRRKEILDELDSLVRGSDTRERDFQKLLERNPWVFGGEVVRSHELRNISTHDQIDIPIIRGDGSMIIVELKQATGATIKTMDHGYPVLGREVHLAVQQAERYLYQLDSDVDRLRSRERFDARRATALVVIGVFPELEGTELDQFEESFRIYNSHLARVQVITYDQLLENARRILDLNSRG